jgi:elongation factor 1-gamma
MEEWYKTLDWEGWSFWRLEYDIYEGEGAKEHITKNLLGGFLNRAEHTNKYTFGRMCVLGDEPNLQIRGVWMMRGQVIPDGLAKEHAQFEYYKTRKLDPRNNKEDD